MITLQSTPKEIQRELDADEVRARYWMMKHHHGEKGFNRWRNEECKRLWLSNDKEHFSEPVEYKSPNGNRWLVYEHISRDGKGGCFSFTYCVCYFETIGSVGAYVRVDCEDTEHPGMTIPGCIYYTSHFFQRFAERLGLEFRSRTMMLRFLQLAHHHLILEKPPRPGYKDREIVMKYPASYAFGTYRDVDGYRMTTIRTFLPVTMMTPAKRKELQEYGDLSDKVMDYIARERLRETSRTEYLPIYK